jgi:alpha-L-fucosidase
MSPPRTSTAARRAFSLLTIAVAVVLPSRSLRAAAVATSERAPTAIGPEEETWRREFGPTHDERMKWWREARFGMFIHWGVYSVPAGVWHGTNVTPSGAEWIMNRGRIPVADYQKFAAQFNPTNFSAGEWVRLARDAGMKYIVITAKHHDGFAMYHSQASPFNIYDATPFKRDPLKELSEACAKAGIKLGFYYSQAQDWNHPGGAAAGSKTGQPVIVAQNHWDAAQQGSMDEYIDRIAVPQVKELLSDYGNIAVWWWDTPTGMNSERAGKLLPLLKLQPQIVSNNRLDKNKRTGDFETPEQRIPATGLAGKDWETCMTLNHTWGYRSYDHDWKSTETLIRNLVDIASKGGNYLLNVGPTSLGEIPAPSVERLREIGVWMKVNGEAIYGTTASPFAHLPWGRCTKKQAGSRTTLYLHVFNWPSDGKLHVPGLKDTVNSATLLATGAKLTTVAATNGLTINLPAVAPDRISSTIVLNLNGPTEGLEVRTSPSN